LSNKLRITGLATGLDVDSMVKSMLKAQNMKLDKVKQDRQLIQWRQDLLRDIIGNLNTFKSTYFDVLKSDSYMLSERNYSGFDISPIDSLTATANAGAIPGDYKVNVTQLAKKPKITGTNTEINVAQALKDFSFPATITPGDTSATPPISDNKALSITIDSNTYGINLDEGNFYLPDLVSKINSKLITATGGDASNKVRARLSDDGKSIKFESIKAFDSDQTLNINDNGTIYSIKIEKGSYTTSDLINKINNKLKSATGANGGTADLFTNNKIVASVSPNGANVVFTNGAGISITNSSIIPTSNMSVINSNATTSNTLEYERKIITGVNDSLSIKVNGKQYNLTLDSVSYGKPSGVGSSTDSQIRNDLISKMQSALENAVDPTVALDDPGRIVNLRTLEKFDVRLSLDQTKIEFVSKTNKTININGNAMDTLGFAPNIEVNQNVDNKMSLLLGGSVDGLGNPAGKVEYIINDGIKDIIFRYDFNNDTNVTVGAPPNEVTVIGAKNKTVSQIMDDISSKANVKLSFSQLTKKFTLESNSTGASENISVNVLNAGDAVTSNFLTTLFGSDSASDRGQDANVIITNPNGGSATVVKPTNSFIIDGVNYNLVKAGGGEKTLTLTTNVQKTFDKIKDFIDKYNDMIDKINAKLGEKRQYKYVPLTDEQKKEMKEDEIKLWEEKAKEGLLKSDSSLENMLFNMRDAFYKQVGAAGITLTDIGLSTSNDISERGKIIIDETKLKNALQNNPDKVAKLFMNRSSVSYDASNRNETRYNEEGIFQRLNDILQDNVRTLRDNNGKKGILLEKAGIKGDFTEFHNILADQIKDKDKSIYDLTKKLADKENYYYIQFSKLETAMQRMNDQSNWLSQQLGSFGGK
jgi:flagellar hook-associated protein 2